MEEWLAGVSWIGGASGDSGFSDRVTPAPFYQNEGNAPTRLDGGAHSRGGWEYEGGDGGNSADWWDSPASGAVWCYFPFAVTTISGSAGNLWVTAFFHHIKSDATGKVRLIVIWLTGNTTYKLRLEIFDGADWITGTNSSTTFDIDTIYYLRVLINTSTAAYGIAVDGGSLQANGTFGTTPIFSTPSFHNSAAKGSGTFTYRQWEIFGNDSTADPTPSTAQTYTSANSNVHCYGAVPRKDVPGDANFTQDSDWRTIGGKHSERFRWAQVDTAYDDFDRDDDYMKFAADSADHDWLFRFNQFTGSESVQAVAISFFTSEATGLIPDKLIARVPSDSTTITEVAGTLQSGFDGSGFFMAGIPANPTTEWTTDFWNEFEGGPRCSDAIASPNVLRLSGMIAHIIGTNLSQPDKALGETPPPVSPLVL